MLSEWVDPDPADVVRTELLQFDWSGYALDEVDDADTEWADMLAERIVYVLKREGCLP